MEKFDCTSTDAAKHKALQPTNTSAPRLPRGLNTTHAPRPSQKPGLRSSQTTLKTALAAFAAAALNTAGCGGSEFTSENSIDAEITETSAPDASDATQNDTANIDTSTPDNNLPDTAKSDTLATDISLPDTTPTDTATPDSTQPDTTLIDTSIPETSIHDIGLPDTQKDTAAADNIVPPVCTQITVSQIKSAAPLIKTGQANANIPTFTLKVDTDCAPHAIQQLAYTSELYPSGYTSTITEAHLYDGQNNLLATDTAIDAAHQYIFENINKNISANTSENFTTTADFGPNVKAGTSYRFVFKCPDGIKSNAQKINCVGADGSGNYYGSTLAVTQ